MAPESDFKKAYSAFLAAQPGRLHFAAHSHHYWPDCTRDAALQYWNDSAKYADAKWDHLFQTVLAESKRHLCELLRVTSPDRFAVAPNTHEFVARIYSCFDLRKPLRVLTTDSEFHSFSRQTRRLEELENVQVERVPVEPFDTFESRFAARAGERFDLVFFSQVFFNSGFRITDPEAIVRAAHPESVIVIDGYHAFGAVPVDLSKIQKRVFFLAGGYKYLQSGEGACFLHVPENCELRPLNTGWFAEFENLQGAHRGVSYAETGDRFAGSTFDPSGWYRFNAVMRWWKSSGITVETVHAHVQALERCFLEKIGERSFRELQLSNWMKAPSLEQHGHFLTFKTARAGALTEALKKQNVIVDFRGDRLRFGFGLYHDRADIEALMGRIENCKIPAP